MSLTVSQRIPLRNRSADNLRVISSTKEECTVLLFQVGKLPVFEIRLDQAAALELRAALPARTSHPSI